MSRKDYYSNWREANRERYNAYHREHRRKNKERYHQYLVTYWKRKIESEEGEKNGK